MAFNNTSTATSGGFFLDKVPKLSALHRESSREFLAFRRAIVQPSLNPKNYDEMPLTLRSRISYMIRFREELDRALAVIIIISNFFV